MTDSTYEGSSRVENTSKDPSNKCFNSIFNNNLGLTKEACEPFQARKSSSYLDCNDTYGRYIGKYKVIKSGPVYEIYEFQFPVRLGIDTSKYRTGIKKKPPDERKTEYRVKRSTRARNLVRRVALMNFSPKDKFLTCTFAENVTDITYANNEFRKFIKRLNRRYGEISYITAIQFQKRGAIHYHTLINLPYVEKQELQEIWGNGIIDIRKLEDVDNVGAYITRYMLRDALDGRLSGKKCYFTSKGLKRPEAEYLNSEGYQTLSQGVGLDPSRVVYTNTYESERNGVVKYTEYNIARDFNSKEKRS